MEVSDYWKKYEAFNKSFKQSDRNEISIGLEDARSYVNGLTDGWHEFLVRLKEIRNSFTTLTNSELETLDKMIRELETNLKN
ncbi:hypothetical protein [Arenibacter algicola]|uniref:Uncharacterized protein n=1 Tax=Arenibacter algicola TaxID=616991 RepID=A0A221UVA5_9FLAO|nr:hypothetical protein [Arenibacter algicola]ASO05242.1 hypothetical protein AREALGSMS7_01776 [Arenibacter algicola]